MKKILIQLAIIITLITGINTLAFAAEVPSLDELTPRPWDQMDAEGSFGDIPQDELKAVYDLPNSTIFEVVTTIIKTVLEISMILTLIAIIVAAVYFLISQGKDEQLTKAKNIILYLLIGMAIIAGSLGIITGITQFKFLE